MQIINPSQHAILNVPAKIRASDLVSLFNSLVNEVNVLSLDCFDTLLWRKTIYPKDVFYDLQRYDAFRSFGITAMQRIGAEDQARRIRSTTFNESEVTLREIYEVGFPSLNAYDIASLVEAELNAEIEACYPYPPMVDLIRAATAQNKQIIVVSNTYFTENHLRRLLKQILPDDVYVAINQVFCSCDYRQSKATGLFDHVLAKVNFPAHSILHIGDNAGMDYFIPKSKGISASHLVQFDPDIKEWQRLYSLAATISDTTVHDKKPLYYLFRGLFSTAAPPFEKPESIIGYVSLGPIMYAFARYLYEEIEKFTHQGKSIKVLFLMRDGYLPFRAYETLYGKSVGQCVRISRFSATAASFKTKKDVIRYLSSNSFATRFEEVCEQLQLSSALTERLIAIAYASPTPEQTFNQLLCTDEMINIILENSKIFRDKLIRYIQKTVNIQPGDSVMLVDIGYIGRTQRVLTPILIEDLKAQEVLGRYLISMNIPEWQKARHGLLNPSWCDDRLMSMIVANVSILEEVCSSCDQSVKGYQDNGDPIFSASNVTDDQRQRVSAIQAECLRFITDAKIFLDKTGMNPSASILNESALYEMVRREYFPLAKEIKYVESFRHDKNKSSRSDFYTFEGPAKEYENLRKQGLCFAEQHPYGLRSSHLGLLLALVSQRRFGFEISLEDISLKRELINVILLINQKPFQQSYPAIPTDDGYYSLFFPIEKGDVQIAILFGMRYRYIQIDSADVILKREFYHVSEKLFSENVLDQLSLNQLMNKGENLFECLSNSSSVIFAPKVKLDESKEYLFRIVFRPVTKQVGIS